MRRWIRLHTPCEDQRPYEENTRHSVDRAFHHALRGCPLRFCPLRANSDESMRWCLAKAELSLYVGNGSPELSLFVREGSCIHCICEGIYVTLICTDGPALRKIAAMAFTMTSTLHAIAPTLRVRVSVYAPRAIILGPDLLVRKNNRTEQMK